MPYPPEALLPHEPSDATPHPVAAAADADLRLAQLARRGNREAFAELWHKHGDNVRAILRAIAPRQDADDLVQEVVLSALHGIADLRQPESFSRWLGMIARNVARRAVNRCASAVPLADVDDCDLPTLPPQSESLDIVEHVRRLPECYHRPLLLRLVLQLSGPEIAAATGMTHGSVRVSLHRGLRLLRQRLGQSG